MQDKDATKDPPNEEARKTQKTQKKDNEINGSSREAMADKYARTRQDRRSSITEPSKKNAAAVSSLDPVHSHNQSDVNNTNSSGSALSSKWAFMKSGFQNFKTNIGARKFLPLQEIHETSLRARVSSSESLDEIFDRLKQRPGKDKNGELDSEDGDT